VAEAAGTRAEPGALSGVLLVCVGVPEGGREVEGWGSGGFVSGGVLPAWAAVCPGRVGSGGLIQGGRQGRRG
jgi:hypothetical protein